MKPYFIVAFVALLLTGCQTMHRGVGSASRQASSRYENQNPAPVRIIPRIQPLQASLVIVHNPACATIGSNWISRVHEALKERNLFTNIEVIFITPDRPIFGEESNDRKNFFVLFLFPNQIKDEDCSLVVKDSWLKDVGDIDHYPNLSLWNPNEFFPCTSEQDVATWVQRIETIVSQKSLQDAVSVMTVLQKPPIINKRLYVFQSFDGWSLCKDAEFADVKYCVVGVGRPFTADGEWVRKPLYWCGTLTGKSRDGREQTVARYATSLDLAVQEMRRQIYPDKPE